MANKLVDRCARKSGKLVGDKAIAWASLVPGETVRFCRAVMSWIPQGVLVVALAVVWSVSATGTFAGALEELPTEAELRHIQQAIERSTVGELTLAEVQRLCEAKIARMPEVKSREEWEAYATALRQRVLDEIVFRGVPAEWRTHKVRVEWLDEIPAGPGYRMRKLRYEALPGLWVPAILYEPETIVGKVPAVLNVNGHTPQGKQYPPKQIRCINMAKKGVIALNIEWVGMGQFHTAGFHHGRMNQLDLCGVSGLAVFYLNMEKGLEVLLTMESVDPARIGMTGLSGGGWQTIVLSSLDTRITLANPVAGYSSFFTRVRHFKDLGDSEQTPTDMAVLADYTHLTAFLAPRPALLTYNAKDECCFEAGYALAPLVEAAAPIYELYGKRDFLRTHINYEPGTHNYERENREAFYAMLRDFFAEDPQKFDATEIPSDGEVKSAEELSVPLPEGNHDFHTLARQFAASLPVGMGPPADGDAFRRWQTGHRETVREVIRFRSYSAVAHSIAQENLGGIEVRWWRVVHDEAITTPAVEFAPASAGADAPPPAELVVLVNDGDAAAVARQVGQLLRNGRKVLVVKPIGFADRGLHYLWHLMIASIGERTVGIQASEIAATAVWWKSQNPNWPLRVVAHGPRATLGTLLAAAVAPEAIDAIELDRPLGSLKDIIDNNWEVTSRPDYFCFGLLQATDLPWLVAAVAPRPVKIRSAPDRLREGLLQMQARGHIQLE